MALTAFGVLAALSLGAPALSLVVLLHAHNLVALAAWLFLYRTRKQRGAVAAPLALVFLGAGLLASGVLLPFTFGSGVYQAFGAHLLAATDILAPGLPDDLAIGLTLSWIFLQSIHYLVWLVLVPMDADAGSGATSFRTSLRVLVRELGGPGFALCAVTFLTFAGLGGIAPLATRNAYLALASFHVWLEVAVLGFLVVRGSRNERAHSAGRAAFADQAPA
jgi:hypothetical protein